MTQGAGTAGERRAPTERQTLSAQLREHTSAAHRGAEASLDLDSKLRDRQSYAELLMVMRTFYRPVEANLAALGDWDELTPAIDVASRRRSALIDDDLGRLGVALPTGDDQTLSALPVLESLAAGVGCLYVAEGSALGGRIVARRARVALGDDLPVTFLSCAGRSDLGRDWRTLQAAINAFGQTQGQFARRRALDSAQQTFGAFRRCLGVQGRR